MSRMKIKNRQAAKNARSALSALNGIKDLSKLPELLQEALKVNQALIEENSRLNSEVSNILEEHDQRLDTLEGVMRRMVVAVGQRSGEVLSVSVPPPEEEPHEG